MNRRDFLILSAINLGMLVFDRRISNAGLKPRPAPRPLPQGIYAVTNTANWVLRDGKRHNLFEVSFVDGVTNYARWADIEKEQGKYNWNGLDRMIKDAAGNNKKLSYNIISGNHVPDWIYQGHGISPYQYSIPHRNKRVKTFLPWVNLNGKREINRPVLEIWEKTIAAFAGHINNHPLKDRIAYVAITGGPTGNGLEIMWAGGTYQEFRELDWDEEAKGVFIQFWMRLIDIYIKYFKDIPLGLAFTDLFGFRFPGIRNRDTEIPKTIVDYAIKSAKINNALIIPMGLWLGNIEPEELRKHPLLKMIQRFNLPFSLQGDIITPEKRILNNMLSLATDIKASWVELWHSDILNKDYVPIINNARNSIRGPGQGRVNMI